MHLLCINLIITNLRRDHGVLDLRPPPAEVPVPELAPGPLAEVDEVPYTVADASEQGKCNYTHCCLDFS